MKKAAILVRVSTDTQEYERQIRDLTVRAQKEGYVVEDRHVFAEKVSGFSKLENRRELTRLLADIRDRKTDISIIYCSELSRISRDPRLARQIIDEACDLGIPFHIEGIGKTLEEDGTRNMTTSIVIQVFAEYAAKEAAITKTRTKSGKRLGAMLGRNTGGSFVPYGYTTHKETKKLMINEEEAGLISRIFQLSIDGMGAKSISRILNKEGHPSRSKKEFSAEVVIQMLTNPLYKGYRRWKGELFPGMPAIVTEDVWEKANAAIDARNVNRARNVKYLYLLDGGRLRCGVCGKAYCAKYHIRKAAHYMCYNRKFGKAKCLNAGIGISQIESLVWSVVKVNWMNLMAHLKKSGGELKKLQVDIQRLKLEKMTQEAELFGKQRQKERIVRAYVKGAYGDGPAADERLDAETKKISKSINNILVKIENMDSEIKIKEAWEVKISDQETFSKMVYEIQEDRMKINEILPGIVEKVIVNSVTPDSNSVEFIVTIFMFGERNGYTVLFNKKTLEFISKVDAAQATKYDENGILLTKVEDLVKIYRRPIGSKSNGKPHFGLQKKVTVIPFSFVNVYQDKAKKVT